MPKQNTAKVVKETDPETEPRVSMPTPDPSDPRKKLAPHPATVKTKLKKKKVFFNTPDQLQMKKLSYEAKLAQLEGKANKRKRLNTLKIIMQINRALKNEEELIKDPDEEKRRKLKDKMRRVAKKLEKKKMRELMQNVVEEERYGVRHSALQSK